MPDFRDLIEFIKDTFAYILIVAMIALIFRYVVAISPIAGNSMNDTLCDGELVLLTRFSYVFKGPKRNDIIIFKDSTSKKYVKRVIGLPGERIDYLNDYLYINGDKYKETLVKDGITRNFSFSDICGIDKCPDGVIPEDKFLVLGDNRNDSKDSRDPNIGLIDKEAIMGKVKIRIYPFNKVGKVK